MYFDCTFIVSLYCIVYCCMVWNCIFPVSIIYLLIYIVTYNRKKDNETTDKTL